MIFHLFSTPHRQPDFGHQLRRLASASSHRVRSDRQPSQPGVDSGQLLTITVACTDIGSVVFCRQLPEIRCACSPPVVLFRPLRVPVCSSSDSELNATGLHLCHSRNCRRRADEVSRPPPFERNSGLMELPFGSLLVPKYSSC